MADSHLAFLKTAETSFAGLSAMLTGEPSPAHRDGLRSSAGSGDRAQWPQLLHLSQLPRRFPRTSRPRPFTSPHLSPHPLPHRSFTQHRPLRRSISRSFSSRLSRKKPAIRPKCSAATWSSRPTLESTPSSASEFFRRCASARPGLREVKPAELAALRTLGQSRRVHARRRCSQWQRREPRERNERHQRHERSRARARRGSSTGARSVGRSPALLLRLSPRRPATPPRCSAAHGARGRPRHRLHQARRDPLRDAASAPRPARSEADATSRTLRTLGQIVDHVARRRSERRDDRSQRADGHAPAAAPARGRRSIRSVLLAVVAEKTGYPAEMLELTWSSKPTSASTPSSASRSSPRCGARARPAAKSSREHLGALRTLGQIVEYIARSATGIGAPGDGRARRPAAPRQPAAAPERRSRGAPARGRRRQDRLSGRDARAAHGARGRPRHRLDQARRDPLRDARARARPARGRRRRARPRSAPSGRSSSTCAPQRRNGGGARRHRAAAAADGTRSAARSARFVAPRGRAPAAGMALAGLLGARTSRRHRRRRRLRQPLVARSSPSAAWRPRSSPQVAGGRATPSSSSAACAPSRASTKRSPSTARRSAAARAVGRALRADGGVSRHGAGHRRRLRPRPDASRRAHGSAASRRSRSTAAREWPKAVREGDRLRARRTRNRRGRRRDRRGELFAGGSDARGRAPRRRHAHHARQRRAPTVPREARCRDRTATPSSSPPAARAA